MSFIRRLFASKADDDYETILANLANDIQKRQLQLSEIRLRERRSTLLATLYTLAAWIIYFIIWYLGALPRFSNEPNHPTVERIAKGIPVFVGPIIILFIRRIFQEWYTRKGNAEEKALKHLMKQRRDKVEEIKKKTNYYSTRDLLQKYDEGSQGSPGPVPPLRQRFPPGQPSPVTPQRPNPPSSSGKSVLQTPGAGLQAQLSSLNPTQPATPRRRQWYDRLADAILGDDDMIDASPGSRYALICEKCFAHNGLVKENMWENYVCPKCGHFNQSSRSKKERIRTPAESATSSPLGAAPKLGPQPLSPGTATSDLPTVDADDTMSMEVDTVQMKATSPL